MIKCVNLNRTNINEFYNINIYREKFNTLNKDFFLLYYSSNFAQQLFMRRRVKLLQKDNQVIGCIWYEQSQKGFYLINSLNIIKDEFDISNYLVLINSIKKYKEVHYECMSNSFNNNILRDLGFKDAEGIVELHLSLEGLKIDVSNIKPDIKFHQLEKYKDEEKRCDIQNDVFYNDKRIPLSIEDIYYDIAQTHYIEEAAIFVERNEEYIGYGQIIIEEHKYYIVNLGILDEFRGRGYGYSLLTHLLYIANKIGIRDIYITVENCNLKAINLYKSLGFTTSKEISKWILSKKAVD